MTRYQRVVWQHSSLDDPVVLYSEIDSDGWEVRKVDEYADGHCDLASALGRTGTTRLGDVVVPPLVEINAEPEFTAVEIASVAFEAVWAEVVRSASAGRRSAVAAAGTDAPFTVGEVHSWRVHAHFPFGLIAEAVDVQGTPAAVLDRTHMPEAMNRGVDDFPWIGSVFVASVAGWWPDGQLRLDARSGGRPG